jgi:hypothetical protein
MSEEDQDLSIGKTVREYIDSKRKLVAIRSELTRIQEQMERIAKDLSDSGMARDANLIGLPTETKIRSLTGELTAEDQRHARLLQAIQQLGLEK